MPVIEELLLRNIPKPPSVLPRYLTEPAAMERLKKVMASMTMHDLL